MNTKTSGVYDILIIGGGPAGLSAGIYSSRARMKTLLLERAGFGGQILTADVIENFPGFPEGINGASLAELMHEQAERFGLEFRDSEAKGLTLKNDDKDHFEVKLEGGENLSAFSLIIATGANWNKLGVPGEEELAGRGVSYCATCDGPLFKNKDIVVVGGGDTALEDAIFLTRFAKRVKLVHRRDRLRATKILQEKAFAAKKIEFVYNAIVTQINGDKKVSGVKTKDVNTGEEKALSCAGVFIFVGISPNSRLFKDILKTDEKGYIITDEDMKTSVNGIFACGDVRKKALRQVVTATGEGALAAVNAQAYIERLKGTAYPA